MNKIILINIFRAKAKVESDDWKKNCIKINIISMMKAKVSARRVRNARLCEAIGSLWARETQLHLNVSVLYDIYTLHILMKYLFFPCTDTQLEE